MTTKNKNLKFLKSKIENENISVPDSLNVENIMGLLDDKTIQHPPEKNITHSRKPIWKAVISIAACIAVTISAVSLYNVFQKDETNLSYIQSNSKFSSYDDLKKTIQAIQNKKQEEYENGKAKLMISGDINGATEDDATAFEVPNASTYETTYTQVDGVDEGDVIKNDGKYIYIANNYGYTDISIYETDDGNSKLVSTITSSVSIKDYGKGAISDMYLYNDKLIINMDYYTMETDYNNKTITIVYDISDKSAPKEIQHFSQEGDYVSSRIVKNHLYVITNKYVYKTSSKKYYAPVICHGSKEETMDIQDVCCVREPTEPSYVIVTSLNLDNCDNYSDTKAVLGAGSNIYCTENNLYVVSEDYEFDTVNINIMKFSLDNGNINFVADGKVKGAINNQYSLDEKDGNLRIATTYNSVLNSFEIYKNIVEFNCITVLDENLKEIGKIDNFAKGESIQAVKFMGDIAYVITFEQTDPLFVIDLSDPTKPEIKGSVKITGFSSMLHPIDENTLIGVGYADEETKYGEWIDGIKLVLFDVSDKTNPKVLDSVIFKYTYSEAQDNPKAFVVNNNKGYYAIPYSDSLTSGAKTFEIENNKIKITNNFLLEKEEFDTTRCTYIGDYVYLIATDYEGNFEIQGFKY